MNKLINLTQAEAYILDLDGTLLDSIGMWDILIDTYLDKFGYETKDDFREQLWHIPFDKAAELTKDYYNLNLSVEVILKQWAKMATEYYSTEVKLTKGAFDFLTKAKDKGIKLAVATSLPRSWFLESLKNNGILTHFDNIYSVEDFKIKSKNSEMYKEIVNELNIDPFNSFVFDDEVKLAIEAKKIGLNFCLMIGEKYTPSSEEKNYIDYYLKDFRDIF